MPAKWSYKRRQQAAAAVQARWNKINGTNKAAVIIIFIICTYLANAEQEQDLHHSTDSNNSTCTQVHNTTGIKMIYYIM